jgi:hypothetical protein
MSGQKSPWFYLQGSSLPQGKGREEKRIEKLT